MKYDDAKLLLRYARLMREIALAKNPIAAMDLTDATIHKSVGFKKLRHWFAALSPRATEGARRYMRAQIVGVRAVLAKAKLSGESLDLSDVEIDITIPDPDAKPATETQPDTGANTDE